MPALLRRKMLLPSQYTLSAVRKQRDLQMEKAVRGDNLSSQHSDFHKRAQLSPEA